MAGQGRTKVRPTYVRRANLLVYVRRSILGRASVRPKSGRGWRLIGPRSALGLSKIGHRSDLDQSYVGPQPALGRTLSGPT